MLDGENFTGKYAVEIVACYCPSKLPRISGRHSVVFMTFYQYFYIVMAHNMQKYFSLCGVILIYDQVESTRLVSTRVRSGWVGSRWVGSHWVGSHLVRQGKVRSGKVRLGQVRSGQVRSGQVRSG